MSRQSKRETAALDDGSGNKRATVLLFGRFIGKKAPSNSLKDWVEAQSMMAENVVRQGYDCDKPGIRRIARNSIDGVLHCAKLDLARIDQLRDCFIRDVPELKQQIIDAYQGDQCLGEVEEALTRWQPNEARMTPTFGVSDLLRGTGLVTSQDVQDAIVRSELNTRLTMVATLEEELKSVFERCDNPDRIRNQLSAVEGLLEKLQPLVQEFSTSPDLVETLNKGMAVLKKLPRDKDGLTSEEGQAIVRDGLAIFETKAEELEVYDGQGGYAHNSDEPVQPVLEPIPDDFF